MGSFVIFNTLSMTVAQRVRELATMRTLGASRRQVRRSVLLEGLIIGLLASIVGLIAGIGLAKGLTKLFDALGFGMPGSGTVIQPRTIIISLAVGTIVTVIATLSPARRATRVPPISAVREGATLPPSAIMRRSSRNGIAVLAIAIALLGSGCSRPVSPPGAVALTVGLGCVALFAGVGLLASRSVKPLAALVGTPAERLGGTPGRLARENAVRNPARTARTAGALMIGLALVTLVATLGSGLKKTVRSSLEQQVSADYVLTSKNGFEPTAATAGAAAARAPGVTLTSSVRADKARAFGSDVDVNGVDPATIGHVYTYRWTQGSDRSLAALGSNGAVIKKSFADQHHLGLGSQFALTTPTGSRAVFRVTGIHKPPLDQLDPVLADVAISQRTFDSRFPRPKNLYTFINVAGGPNPTATAALDRAITPYPDAKVADKAAWVTTRSNGINKILKIFYVLLALSVIISLFGMVNALVLSVFERTREIGMLRAVGHDTQPNQAHGPPRERHHRADRRLAGPTARNRHRGGDHPGAAGRKHRLLASRHEPARPRNRRDRGRGHRGRSPGQTSVATERPPSAPLRVAHRGDGITAHRARATDVPARRIAGVRRASQCAGRVGDLGRGTHNRCLLDVKGTHDRVLPVPTPTPRERPAQQTLDSRRHAPILADHRDPVQQPPLLTTSAGHGEPNRRCRHDSRTAETHSPSNPGLVPQQPLHARKQVRPKQFIGELSLRHGAAERGRPPQDRTGAPEQEQPRCSRRTFGRPRLSPGRQPNSSSRATKRLTRTECVHRLANAASAKIEDHQSGPDAASWRSSSSRPTHPCS